LRKNEGKPVKSEYIILETQMPVVKNKLVAEPRTVHQLTMLLKISEVPMRNENLEGHSAEQRHDPATALAFDKS
jgi:hypothetical protein